MCITTIKRPQCDTSLPMNKILYLDVTSVAAPKATAAIVVRRMWRREAAKAWKAKKSKVKRCHGCKDDSSMIETM